MAATNYFAAAYPQPWTILGVQLKPFSLGHYLKLKQFDNAFVADGARSATLEDLLLGVAVCSMSSSPDPGKDEFWTWISSPPRWNFMAWLLGKTPLTPAEKQILHWGRKIGQFDLAEKCKMFQAYIESHSANPEYWILKDGGGSSPGSHWAHGVIQTICDRSGYTQEDAYNVPMSKAIYDSLKVAETEGVIRFKEECNGA